MGSSRRCSVSVDMVGVGVVGDLVVIVVWVVVGLSL